MGAEQFQPGQGDDRPSRTVTCEDARRAEDCGKVSRLCWCDADGFRAWPNVHRSW